MRHPAALVMLLALTECAGSVRDASNARLSGATEPPDRRAQARGATYAQANCAGCHAVGLTGDSPLPAAPHFRDLGQRYPVDDLAEAFAEGIDTAHAGMPEFVMSTGENSDLIAYLKSIQQVKAR